MYTLYHHYGLRSTAPLLVLEEGGLPYELRTVDIAKDEHRTAAYRAINPRSMVPTLVLEDGQVLAETGAIMLYLADHHRLTHLAPLQEEPGRGALHDWLFYHVGVVQEAGKRAGVPVRYSTDADAAPGIQERALQQFVERWRIVDAHLAAHGPYHLGDRFSLVDLYLLTMSIYFEPVYGLSIDAFPAVKRCYDLVAARPKCAPILTAHIEGIRDLLSRGGTTGYTGNSE